MIQFLLENYICMFLVIFSYSSTSSGAFRSISPCQSSFISDDSYVKIHARMVAMVSCLRSTLMVSFVGSAGATISSLGKGSTP